MPFVIKIIIVLAVIGLLRIIIWREPKRNPYHGFIQYHFGGHKVAVMNYSALIFMGLAAIIIVFSLPDKNLGLIIGVVLGLIGTFIAM